MKQERDRRLERLASSANGGAMEGFRRPACAHREQRSASARRPVLHIVAPGLEVAQATPRKGETVTAFLRRTGWATRDPRYGWQFRKRLPTILEVNGEAVLRKDWRRTKIAANDNVRFVSFPRGGGKQGKQVLGLVALIAVAAFASWAGGAIATQFFAGSAVAQGVATAAIGLGGALLVNALERTSNVGGECSGSINSGAFADGCADLRSRWNGEGSDTEGSIYAAPQLRGSDAWLVFGNGSNHGGDQRGGDVIRFPQGEYAGVDAWLRQPLSASA